MTLWDSRDDEQRVATGHFGDDKLSWFIRNFSGATLRISVKPTKQDTQRVKHQMSSLIPWIKSYSMMMHCTL